MNAYGIELMGKILRAPIKDHGVKLLLVALAQSTNENGETKPISNATLQEVLQRTENPVRDIIARAKKTKLLERIPNVGDNGRQTANSYRVSDSAITKLLSGTVATPLPTGGQPMRHAHGLPMRHAEERAPLPTGGVKNVAYKEHARARVSGLSPKQEQQEQQRARAESFPQAKTRTVLPVGWTPDATIWENLLTTYPTLNLPDELDAFREYNIRKERTAVNWSNEFRGWMRRAWKNAVKETKAKAGLYVGQSVRTAGTQTHGAIAGAAEKYGEAAAPGVTELTDDAACEYVRYFESIRQFTQIRELLDGTYDRGLTVAPAEGQWRTLAEAALKQTDLRAAA